MARQHQQCAGGRGQNWQEEAGGCSQTGPCPIQSGIRMQSTLHYRATHSELQSTERTGSCLDGRSSMSVDSESDFHLRSLVQSQCLELRSQLRSERMYMHAGGDFREAEFSSLQSC